MEREAIEASDRPLSDPQRLSGTTVSGRGPSRPCAIAVEFDFPEGFLWGTATAAHQVEGGNVNNDSWEREHDPDSDYSES